MEDVQDNTEMKHLGMKIVVVNNGFVFVGDVTTELRDGKETLMLISRAKNIRQWGSEGVGLGGLINGPLAKTVTDETGEVIVPWGQVIHYITVESGW